MVSSRAEPPGIPLRSPDRRIPILLGDDIGLAGSRDRPIRYPKGRQIRCPSGKCRITIKHEVTSCLEFPRSQAVSLTHLPLR